MQVPQPANQHKSVLLRYRSGHGSSRHDKIAKVALAQLQDQGEELRIRLRRSETSQEVRVPSVRPHDVELTSGLLHILWRSAIHDLERHSLSVLHKGSFVYLRKSTRADHSPLSEPWGFHILFGG